MEAIVAFLTARYDEAEARARGVREQKFGPNAAPSPFEGLTLTFVGDRVLHQDIDITDVYDEWTKSLPLADSSKATLADIAAKRAIMAEHVGAEAYYRTHTDAPAGELTGLGTAVRLLAQPYAEHPDFDPAWRVA